MTYYLHETPGRLRIKIPGLRGDSETVNAIRDDLMRRRGVQDVQANPVTGSITVIHDPDDVKAHNVLEWFREQGAIEEGWDGRRPQMADPALSKAGAALGKALFGFAVDLALERSGLSLLAVLL